MEIFLYISPCGTIFHLWGLVGARKGNLATITLLRTSVKWMNNNYWNTEYFSILLFFLFISMAASEECRGMSLTNYSTVLKTVHDLSGTSSCQYPLHFSFVQGSQGNKWFKSFAPLKLFIPYWGSSSAEVLLKVKLNSHLTNLTDSSSLSTMECLHYSHHLTPACQQP